MTVNRTTLLDLPLPVTGTESGTWGDTTNNGLTQYMDIAIAGMSNLTSANFTTGALTIETTEGNSSATNITATSGQYAGFRVTSLAQNSTITVGNTGTSPARSYRLINADATYTLTFKATGQTGITLQPGQTAVVAFNGTDYVIVGMAGAGTVTDNAVVRFDGTTGKLVQNSVVTIADSTGDVAGVGALTMGGNLTLSGGTANGVLYLNGSKVATSGSALTFDGAQLGVNGITVGRGAGAVSTNTAVGASALAANTTGAENTAVGNGAAGATTTGNYNTAVGRNTFALNTTGSSNSAFGQAALYTNLSGSNNTGIGFQALALNTTASNNTAVGYQAAYSNTTGSGILAVGYQAGYSNTVGNGNTAIGNGNAFTGAALYSNVSGNNNVAVGSGSLNATTASNNTAVGYEAARLTTSGGSNVAFGTQALYSNTTASNNTAVGYQAGYSNTTGAFNSFIGRLAGYSNTTASAVTAVGNGAAYANTTGTDTTAVGSNALVANTTGAYNTALGSQSLYSNTTASNNTAVGYQAGYSNTTSPDNSFFGYQAGYSSTTNGGNTAIGKLALYANTGYQNTAVGSQSLQAVTSGVNNTAIGKDSGSVITTGSKNTIIGCYTGNQGGLDIRTASNYIVLSDGDGNPLVSTYANGTVALQGAVPNNGTGITFPATQSASSNANTLDDYEEGNWTPSYTGTSGDPTVSYITRTAKYVKIGKQVTAWCYVYISSTAGGGGNIYLSGLPFTCTGVQGGAFNNWTNNGWTTQAPQGGHVPTGQTYVMLTYYIATGTAQVPVANLANACELTLCVTYQTD